MIGDTHARVLRSKCLATSSRSVSSWISCLHLLLVGMILQLCSVCKLQCSGKRESFAVATCVQGIPQPQLFLPLQGRTTVVSKHDAYLAWHDTQSMTCTTPVVCLLLPRGWSSNSHTTSPLMLVRLPFKVLQPSVSMHFLDCV